MSIFNFFKPKMKPAIEIIYNSYSSIGEERHKTAQYIISKYSTSNKPLDNLAVAMAYEWEGAKYRPNAIEYYEKYFISGEKTSLFNEWVLYSSLEKLYEKEYIFDKALICLDRMIVLSNKTNPSDYTRKGDIYTKQDINKAVQYYENLMKSPCYKMHKHAIDCAYETAKEKQEKGYVYKPRKKKSLVQK